MNNSSVRLCLFLVVIALFVSLTGCGAQVVLETSAPVETETPPVTEGPVDESGEPMFPYSEGLDENGFWKGIRALDYVELLDYKSLPVPASVYNISDADLQAEIDRMLVSYQTENQITDRAVANGDTVNIDYVGSVGGVEFEGGSTGGSGANVTAGSTEYVDDFLTQIIGHKPGETIDIKVTFPEDYGKEELNGKDAVFVTTINYIAERVSPEMTDSFVEDNLLGTFGWNNVAEVENAKREELQKTAVKNYVNEFLAKDSNIRSMPDSIAEYTEKLVEYQEKSMLDYYQGYADSNGMELEEFIVGAGFSGLDELIESNRTSITQNTASTLVVQAIAEDAGFSVSNEEIASYFAENTGSDDYSYYEEQFGLPYIKQVVLHQKVFDYVVANAALD